MGQSSLPRIVTVLLMHLQEAETERDDWRRLPSQLQETIVEFARAGSGVVSRKRSW
jgi:hypothetical protein